MFCPRHLPSKNVVIYELIEESYRPGPKADDDAFYLAGLIAYARHLERPGPRPLALAFVAFALACLAKATAVSFPLALVVLELWKRRAPWAPRALLEKFPFFALALLVGLVAVDVQGGGDFHGWLSGTGPGAKVVNAAALFTPLQRFALPAYGCLRYLVRFVAPLGLSAFDPYPQPGLAGRPLVLLAPLLVLALLAVALWDLRRTRVLTFGLGWFLATIVFVLQWKPVGLALTADRYSYLPLVGVYIMFA